MPTEQVSVPGELYYILESMEGKPKSIKVAS